MKNNFLISFSAVLLAMLVGTFFFGNTAKAFDNELKNQWYISQTFPMNPDSKLWTKYSLEENLDILNPPEDLIHNMPTKTLAELMMDYPHLWVLTSYEFEQKDIFWNYLSNNCAIYNELLSREDGIECLLERYISSPFNPSVYNKNPYIIWGYNQEVNAEVFGCQFVNQLLSHPQKYNTDINQINKVIAIKTELYNLLINNDTRMYLTFDTGLGSDHCSDFSIENNHNSVMVANGFTSNGSAYARSIENVSIYFTPGTYHKFGTDSSCLKWYSGDYSISKRDSLNNSIAYSWLRLMSATPKYNCHGYAWLNATATDGYWLDSPSSYINNGSVLYIGGSPMLAGDIIVMYNSSGVIVHSAVVSTTPVGTSSIETRSKLGGRGLYIAPLSELMTYYCCTSYRVYRP